MGGCWAQAQGKDVRTLRSLYYLAEVYCSPGAAGTPTLYDPTLGALGTARHAGWCCLYCANVCCWLGRMLRAAAAQLELHHRRNRTMA